MVGKVANILKNYSLAALETVGELSIRAGGGVFGTQNFLAVIVDHDLHIIEASEISKELDAESEEIFLMILVIVENNANWQPGGEDCGISRCYNCITRGEDCVSGQFFKQSHGGVEAIPHERSEMVGILDFARQAEIGIQE